MTKTGHPSAVAPMASALLPLNLIGRSDGFLHVLDTVSRIANFDVVVSIYGETGTGKELIARALHYLSDRKSGPFVPVNCGAIPDTLLESQLFGHKRGAFTDANADRFGFIAQASGGTLFLDEIESLTSKGQVALLRFLQDMTYQRVGGTKLHAANVRVVAASNVDLRELSQSLGEFREDLFYRLNVLPIRIPPLRERHQDIPLLASHFLDRFRASFKLPNKYFGDAALAWLKGCDWPGNVREMENAIQRGMLLAEGDEILPYHMMAEDSGSDSSGTRTRADEFNSLPFKAAKQQVIDRFEREYVKSLLLRFEGNLTQAAQYAETERRTLGRLLKKHDIERIAMLAPER
jgi:two-component system response regulator GlrR